jgi:hypothetical protein
MADKSWSVCTVTEHVKRNTFLVSRTQLIGVIYCVFN